MAKENKKNAKVRRQLYREIMAAVDAEDFDGAKKIYKKYKKETGRKIRMMEAADEKAPAKKKTKKPKKDKKAEKKTRKPKSAVTRAVKNAHKEAAEKKKGRKTKDDALKEKLPERVYQAIQKLHAGAEKVGKEIVALEDALFQKRAEEKVYHDCITNLVKGFKTKRNGKKETEEK